ncbi:phage tail tip fiber protein [Paracoccus aminovorans]|uniref:phage tail tip fiber protein n=1 Tax=Paracoccus aminovorans TaxID=34004 RepID=UPI0007865980|nr:hypothetical protein [Paracoccus aminovorans]
MSDSVQQVSVITNEASAYGRLRVSAWGTGADAGARIGILAWADTSRNGATAALFIEALTNGNSRVNVVASQFAVVGGAANDPVRSVPFYVRNSAVYMTTAFIEEATIGTLHLANGAVVGGYTTTLSGAHPSWNTHAEIARFTVNLPEAYRGILFYECTNIESNDGTASCSVGVQVNGVGVPGSGSLVTARRPDRSQDTTMASRLRLITLSHGNNVIRLWGTNTQAVSYKLDLLTFKR